MSPTSRDYDEAPYTDHAYAEAHPDRLAVVARLSGWDPPALHDARVLELGCGRGGHLLPMAESLPGATLVGVDLSARHVEHATRLAAETGLTRVRFVEGDVASFEPSGEYAFVVAHGLASWVTPPTRQALLSVVARALAPGGVAYVSFNTLPGWYERMPARDWLRAFGRDDPRAALAWLHGAVSPELGDHRRRIEAVAARLGETEAAYARHEYLAEENHPLYVEAFLAEAHAAGLAYLGDAIPGETAVELLSDEVAARAAELDEAAALSLVDFVRNTAFRRALFVRAVDATARGWTRPRTLLASALGGLCVASHLRPRGAPAPGAASEQFDVAGGVSVSQTDRATRGALHELAGAAPRALPFMELARRAGDGGAALASELLELWLATGAIAPHVHEPALGSAADTRPTVSTLARWRARDGGPLTNLWHEAVRLDDPALRDVMALLDGTRTVGDVTRALGRAGPTAALDDAARAALAEASVQALAAAGLLVKG